MIDYTHKVEADKAMENGSFAEALALYSKALALDPTNPVILSDRGVCYFNDKQMEKALDDLNRSAELDPANPYRYSSRAFVKGAMKDTQGAIADYQKAIELDPEDAISRNNLGLIQEQFGHYKEAKENFDKADKLAGLDKNESPMPNEDNDHQDKSISIQSAKKNSLLQEAKEVITSKSKFNEFLRFVKNGFKLDQ